jgi:hypothetical protein
MSAAFATLLASVFCASAWHHATTLALLSASALLWLVPIHPRWWPRHEGEIASPAARSAADIALLIGCWGLSTWALWQHRMLPLAVCATACALVLFDVASRPEAPPPLCTPERSPRRRALRTDRELAA